MNRFTHVLCVALASTALLSTSLCTLAQDQAGTAIVSLYRVAPGKHRAFLKWMADRESAAAEAGAPATKWYRHLDGDSWDYIAIAPAHNDAIDSKADAIAKQRGLTIGMRSGLELRELMASHTDTYVAGPMTAAEMVEEAGKP
jgi:hypothetical protein